MVLLREECDRIDFEIKEARGVGGLAPGKLKEIYGKVDTLRLNLRYKQILIEQATSLLASFAPSSSSSASSSAAPSPAVATRRLLENLKREEAVLKTQLEELSETLAVEMGPRRLLLEALMDALGLLRTSYHGGKFIGKHCSTIMTPVVFKALCQVVETRAHTLQDGSQRFFPEQDSSQKFLTLFSNFKACYSLFARSEPLCRHQVFQLEVACANFGNCFARDFPESSWTHKAHILTHEIPRFARMNFTVGMMAEHSQESIHPLFNGYQRIYCCIRNPLARLLAKTRQHQIEGAYQAPAPKKRKRP